MKQFNELGIGEPILKSISKLGYENPTLVQEQAIPALASGQDIIILSQTGSGKTLAFAVPALQTVNAGLKKPQVLIICPTRELATQVADEMKKIGQFQECVKTFAVFGGQPIFKQIDGLKRNPQIIVGTPGRILDHIERRTLKLETVQMLILDEADEMLKMGFREDIEAISKKLAGHRQGVLASATMSREIKALSEKFLKNPVTIDAGDSNSPAKSVKQEYILVTPRHKKQAFLKLLQTLTGTALVFCNTKRMTTDLFEFLNENGIPAEEIHGDMRQNERTRAMNNFKNKSARILVATDVAARGIDVNNITYVINYDYPIMEEYYIHRIGRTGRAGNTGLALTYITTTHQLQDLLSLSKKLSFEITKNNLSDETGFEIKKPDSFKNKTNNSYKNSFDNKKPFAEKNKKSYNQNRVSYNNREPKAETSPSDTTKRKEKNYGKSKQSFNGKRKNRV